MNSPATAHGVIAAFAAPNSNCLLASRFFGVGRLSHPPIETNHTAFRTSGLRAPDDPLDRRQMQNSPGRQTAM